ncbi:hypothetical protein T484DRAFT_1775638 [Baffinella frigidus]|nr:hypothetical protein T484DRAFT_1775638 [Cryptophyta sp. CCMP2293]
MVVGDARVAEERLAAEAAMDLSSELQGARSSYFEALEDGEDVDKKKFTYAWTLIHQKGQADLVTGISLLDELSTNKEVAREALYFLAAAQFRLGKFALARATLKKLQVASP